MGTYRKKSVRATGRKRTVKKDFKRSTYVEALDSVFSHYIRQKYADSNGMVKCYTCEAVLYWKEIQNGHYFSRKSLSTRWEATNARPQCFTCNVYRSGNYPTYGTRLAAEIGAEEMAKIEQLNHMTVKWNNADLLGMIQYFYSALRWPDEISQQLRTLLKRLKVL